LPSRFRVIRMAIRDEAPVGALTGVSLGTHAAVWRESIHLVSLLHDFRQVAFPKGAQSCGPS
jgi:hypothetical protein